MTAVKTSSLLSTTLLLLFGYGDSFTFKQRHSSIKQPQWKDNLRRHGTPREGGSIAFNKSVRAPSWELFSSAAASNDDVCTVQILMSDTGGGHRASANALSDAFDVLHPGKIEVDIVDIYTDYGPFWPFNWYVPAYKIMAEYSFLWKSFYEFGCTPFGLWLNELVLDVFCFEPFMECMNRPSCSTDKRADMVVSVHPLCQDLPLKILSYLDSGGKTKTGGRTTPFITVVTDLGGAHPTWFNPGVDVCFVPSNALDKCARDRKLKESQIVQYGLPIRKGFWGDDASATVAETPAPKGFFANIFGNAPPAEKQDSTSDLQGQLRDKLGLERGPPTVLIVGGGDGMGGIIQQAKSLGLKLSSDAQKDDSRFQMAVVCGSNAQAKKELESVEWGDGVNVIVNGFVNNMDEWMKASDAIVTKAGPGTIAEASICGLPCMLSSFLPGQEEGNVPYVENAGFGEYSGDPTAIAEKVSFWLETPEKLASMKMAALEAARPSATIDIARDIAQILFESKAKK
mmetsp:Transcript_36583/g.53730  ORF Transcript_36583/g.53730 Transcript_36583/m.53730 type:complete len:513 (-) Transcript_36583:84-1622(-)|eukprot:CAMPEP_0195539850 /NCGR_PEP_ID=MMETSP0794_2-20130614/50272_1 /TAXON_ID=515487 /ORGANISM="Stephanopyxis turris, Strain CCMP 815" /LENGTH=512 /DNA_ID=CAMNT_0040673905 /DNA_START=71 /DNA_END=1609 /DNA_ORIENTATION=-